MTLAATGLVTVRNAFADVAPTMIAARAALIAGFAGLEAANAARAEWT